MSIGRSSRTVTSEAHQNIPERPTLRLVEPMWVEHMGRRFLHLRDPMSLSDVTVMIPEAAAPVVTLLDGSRNLAEIRSALALRFGITATDGEVRSMIGQLDQALLIGNGEYRRARRRALKAYRDADHRPPSHVGAVYPESASALEATIERWCGETSPNGHVERPDGEPGRDAVSAHRLQPGSRYVCRAVARHRVRPVRDRDGGDPGDRPLRGAGSTDAHSAELRDAVWDARDRQGHREQARGGNRSFGVRGGAATERSTPSSWPRYGCTTSCAAAA